MTIKHLVLSGGGPIMIQTLGALQQLEKKDFLNIKNIESIYGTSAGAIVGVLICLNYDWETINDYILKRPWQDVFNIKVENIFDAYTKKGVFDIKVIEKCLKPLLDAKDISMDITLEDFYAISKIDLHLFTFEINEYKVHDISHLTHPELPLKTAIQMTCALPILISPVCIDNHCFIDGGMVCNYPLNYCISSGKNIDEILSFKNKYNDDKNYIHSETNMVDYLFTFLFKAVFSLSTDHIQPSIKYELLCNANYLSINMLKDALSSIEVRKDLFNNGIETADLFLSKVENENENKNIINNSEETLERNITNDL